MNDSQDLQNILTIEYGNHRKTVILQNEVYSVGRHSSNSIVISHPAISRYHCTLLPVKYKDKNEQEAFWIIDGDLKGNRSSNGLFINDNKCLSYELKPKDVIYIGGNDIKATYDVIHPQRVEDSVFSSEESFNGLVDYQSDNRTLIQKWDDQINSKGETDSPKTVIFHQQETNQVIEDILFLLLDEHVDSFYALVQINLEGEIIDVNRIFVEKYSHLTKESNYNYYLKDLAIATVNETQKYLVRKIKYKDELITQYSHYIPEKELVRIYFFNFQKKTEIELALRESEERYRAVVRQISEGIVLIDPITKKVLEANKAYCSLLGYKSEEILNLHIYDLVAIDQEVVDSIISRIIKERLNLVQESIHCRKDKTLVHVEVSMSMIFYSAKKVICYAVRDITERKSSEEMLRYQACHDLLTNLGNRNLFNQNLNQAINNSESHNSHFAILFLDLDRFKNVNDTLGHDVGDQLLQEVSKVLQSCLRSGDFVARWGGDEFTILLSQIGNIQDASRIAQRIINRLKSPFHICDHKLYANISIGISVYPQDGKTPETLLKNADIALYRSKEQGGSNYNYYKPLVYDQREELLKLESYLHNALQNEEFAIYYQPQIDLTTNQIIGMEALIRWENKDLGNIPPDKFIPLAEETGLILEIGEWVLNSACLQNKKWQDMGLNPIKVAVNLSARQFQQYNLTQMVSRVLKKTQLQPEYLELEVTETSIIQNCDFSRKIFNELKALGVSLSMDDFGTGYSSLGYLKRFPFDKIKIDQTFVRDLKNDPQDLAVIAAVITLGNGFNLRIIAEGVETEEQLNLLLSLDCRQMQGYYFSKPLRVEDATKLLSSPFKFITEQL